MTARTAGRPRLRQLRAEAGWTQQELANKVLYLAWTKGYKQLGLNADMVAKWERGAKGISACYRLLLCELFGVTPEQLGVAPTARNAPPAAPDPVRDPNSLVSMLDQAAALLDQLGAPGTVLAPQMLSAWKDTTTSRRTMLGLLDPAATDPAGHARAVIATIEELEQLADRYRSLYATADPAALLTTVAAHVKLAGHALHRNHTPAERHRVLRNLAQVATLAGRLAYDDLGDAMSGRAYYTLALDAARDAGDHPAIATALGHTALLSYAEGHPVAALDHLAAAATHTRKAPTLASWLAGIEATIHADRGQHAKATVALARANATSTPPPATDPTPGEHPAYLAAVAGHIHLRAGDHTTARTSLTAALDGLPTGSRRARVLILLDLAHAELQAGDLATACHYATTAAGLLDHTSYATGATQLRTFRNAAAVHHAEPKVLRTIDQSLLAHTAA